MRRQGRHNYRLLIYIGIAALILSTAHWPLTTISAAPSADTYYGGSGDGWGCAESSNLALGGPVVTLSSADHQTFYVGNPPTGAETMTITDSTGGAITAAGDLRVRIPADFNMVWYYNGDASDGNFTINAKPTVTFNSAAQSADGDGKVTANADVADGVDDTCKLKVEYSTDSSNWYDPTIEAGSITADFGSPGLDNGAEYQIGTSGAWILTSSGSNSIGFKWLSATDLPTTSDSTVYLRFTANDGTLTSTAVTSSAFTVDNVDPTGLAGLAVSEVGHDFCTLTWSGTASDDNFHHYEVWYGTSLTDVGDRNDAGDADEWDNDNDSALSNSGTATTTIENIAWDENTWYFKIWAVDAYGNDMTTDHDSVSGFYVWDGSEAGGAWATAANWKTNSVPGATADVIIDGNYTYAPVLSSSTTIASLKIGGASTLTLDGSPTLKTTGDVTIYSGANITHTDNSTTETHKVTMTIGGNLTINAGGTIDVDALGYDDDYGPGAGSSLDCGGYGGIGADYENGPTSSTYGSITAPTNLGSGGHSGDGGGAIVLNVTGTSTISGTISARGEMGVPATGSGGSIYLTTGTISGAGTIRADGGEWSSSYGGGGGRVAIILTSGNNFDSVTISAYGGNGAASYDGAAGTVYKQTQTQGANGGDLIIDNPAGRSVASGVVTDINSSCTDTTVGDLKIENTGLLNVNSGGSLTLAGDTWTGVTSSNMIANDASTITYTSATDVTLINLSSYGNLTVNNGSTTFSLPADLDCNGNLTITAGTLDSNTYDIDLAGNWDCDGSFTYGTKTVTLSGSDKSVSGSATFYNFTKSVASADTLTFDNTGTQTIAASGTLTLSGESGELLVLISDSDGNQWGLTVNGSTAVDYVDVKDSDASGGILIVAVNSTDSLNNLNWDINSGTSPYEKTWVGTTTAWATSSNWSPVDAPGSTDDVLIDGSATAQPTLSSSTTIASLTIGGNSTLTFDGDGSVALLKTTGDVTIYSGATLTHNDNTTTEEHKLNMNVGGNLEIKSGGSIDVDGLGYDGTNGPGVPSGSFDGGSYGGIGGDKYIDGGIGSTYGSITAPTNLGSGSTSSSGHGGGAIILNVTGTSTINGTINADGVGTSGSGSGGSVYIATGTISGSGTIQANGGSDASEYGGGGGGRVAVILTSGDSFGSITVNAYGGNRSGTNNDGAAGTVYKQTATQGAGNGDLIIDNPSARSCASDVVTDLNGNAAASVTVGTIETLNAALFTIGSDDTLTLGGSGTTITIGSGTILTNNNIFNIGGTIFTETGTFTLGSGCTVEYIGQSNNADVTPLNKTYQNLSFNKAGTTFNVPADNFDIDGNITLKAGELDATTSNYTIKAGGDWSNTGGLLNGRTGTVEFDGTTQTISGSTTFYNFEKSVTSADTLTFSNTGTQTIEGLFKLVGASGDLLYLRSDSDGEQWELIANGTFNIDYVDVQDSDASDGDTVELVNFNNDVNSGNNDNWEFGYTFTWTGAGDGVSWSDADNWSSTQTGYPDDANDKAIVDTTGNNLIHIDELAAGGGSVTIGELAVQGTSGKLTLLYKDLILDNSGQYNGTLTISGGTLDLSTSNHQISIDGKWKKTGGTFTAQNGTVNFTRASGTQTLRSGGTDSGSAFYNVVHSGAGTLQLDTNDIKITGNWKLSAGTFDANSRMVEFNKTSASTSTISGATTFYDLKFSGDQSGWDIGDNLVVENDLTITNTSSGTNINAEDAETNTITVKGDVSHSGSVDMERDLTIVMAGSSTQAISTSNTGKVGSLKISNESATVSLGSNLLLAGDLTIDTNTTLDVTGSNYNITLNGGWSRSGTFTQQQGTVEFTKSAALTSTIAGDTTFYNLEFGGSESGWDVGNDLVVENNLTITNSSSGTNINAESTETHDITVSGDVSHSDTVDMESDLTIVMGGSSAQNIGTSSTGKIGALQVSNTSNTVSLSSALLLAGSLTVDASTTLDCSSYDLSCGGASWNVSSTGTFTSGTNTVTFNYSGAPSIVTGGTDASHDFNNVIVNIGASTNNFAVTTNDLDVDGNLTISAGRLNIDGTARKIYLAGDLTIDSTNVGAEQGAGDLVFDGAALQTITDSPSSSSDTDSIAEAQFSNTTANIQLGSAIAFDKGTIDNGATLDLNGNNITFNGIIFNNGTIRSEGGETVTFNGFGGFDEDSGTVIFDGTTTYSAGLPNGFGDHFYNLTFNGNGGEWQLDNALTVDGTLIVTDGTLYLNGNNVTGSGTRGNIAGKIKLNGSESVFWTTNDVDSGTYEYVGTGTAIKDFGTNDYYNLTINSNGNTFTLGANLDVDNTLTITAGTLDVTATPYNINIGGDWSNSGSLTARTGTVEFDGADQTVTGSTTFYNFKKSVTAADTLSFSITGTQIIATGGELTLTGASNEYLYLARSSGSGLDQWGITLSSGATNTCSYLDVNNSDASGGQTIGATYSRETEGNNTNWDIMQGDLTSTNVEPDTLVVGITGSCVVSFTTANNIPADGKIEVVFPSGFVGDSGGTSAATSSSMTGTLSVSVSSNTVTMTRGGGATEETGGEAESITLTYIKNPDDTGSTGTYSIATQDSTGTTIDLDSAVQADTLLNGGSLSSTDVEPASLLAGAQGNVVVSFTAANPIPSDGKIIVTFPSGFDLTSIGSTATSGTMDGSFAASDNGQVATITRSNGSQEAAGAESLTLTTITNPTTAGSTGVYQLQTNTASSNTSTGRIDYDPDDVEADDIAGPSLSSWDLNMNTGVLTMHFDTSVDADVFDAAGITLQDVEDATGGANSYTLTSASTTSSSDGADIVVNLCALDLDSIKDDTNLAVSEATSYLYMTTAVINDIYNNPVTAIANTSATQVSGGNYTADGTAPSLSTWTIDMDTGQMELNFNEPIALSGFDITTFTIQDDAAGTNSVSLSGTYTQGSYDGLFAGEYDIGETNNKTLQIKFSTANLNSIKSDTNIATLQTDSYLEVAALSGVQDKAPTPNVLAAIDPGEVTDGYNGDSTAPTLITVSATSTHSSGDTITLTFDEPMDTSTISAGCSTLTIQYADNGSGLNAQTLTTTNTTVSWSGLTEVTITLDEEDDSAYIPAGKFVGITPALNSVDDISANSAANSAVYTGSGVTAEQTEPALSSVTVSDDPCGAKGVGELTITLVFDECMDTSTEPTVSYDPDGDTGAQDCTGGTWPNKTTYIVENDNAIVYGTGDGTAQISVGGAKDLVGNTMITDTSNSFVIDTTILEVTGIDDPIVAGTAASVTVTVKKGDGSTDTDYTSTVTFSSSDTQADLPSDYTFQGSDNGEHTFTDGVTLKTEGEQSVTATDTAVSAITGTQSAITVTADTTTAEYVFSTSPGTDLTAGNRVAYVVARRDAYGNAQTSGVEQVYLSTTNTTGSAAGTAIFKNAASGGTTIVQVPIADTESSANFWYYDQTTGTWTITAGNAAENPTISATHALTVVHADANKFKVTDSGDEHSASLTAGTTGMTIKATIYDEYDNIATTSYGENTGLTFSGASVADDATNPTCNNVNFGTDTLLTFSSGVASCTMRLYKAENAAIKASLTSDSNITTSDADDLDVTVVGGGATSLSWDTKPETMAVAKAPWKAFSVKVSDDYGNVSSATPTVSMAPSTGDTTASSTTSVQASSGIANFSNFAVYNAADDTASGYPLEVNLTASSSGLDDITLASNEEVYVSRDYAVEIRPFDYTSGNALSDVTITVYDADSGEVYSYPSGLPNNPATNVDIVLSCRLPYDAYQFKFEKSAYVETTVERTADVSADYDGDDAYDNSIVWEVRVKSLEEERADYHVRSGFVYDEVGEDLTMRLWLEKRGKLILNDADGTNILGDARVKVYNETTRSWLTTIDLEPPASTVTDVGTYKETVTDVLTAGNDFGAVLTEGRTYFANCEIDYGGASGTDTTYEGGTTFTITVTESLSREIIGKIGELAEGETLATKIADIKSDLGVTGTDTVASKIGDVKSETAEILVDTGKTIPDEIDVTQEKVTTLMKSEILNRETQVKSGDTLTIRYRTYTGLSTVTIDVYDADNTKKLSAKTMTEVGTTGVYEYDVEFKTAWSYGDFTVACSESTYGTFDAMIISVITTDIDDISSSVSAVLGVTAGLGDLDNVVNTLEAQIATIEASLSGVTARLAAEVEEAVASAADLETVFDQLKLVSAAIREIETTTEEMELDKFYDIAVEKKQDMKYLKNKTQELRAMMELNQKMIDNVANEPVIQTWYEYRSVVLKALIVNPSDSQPRTVPFKAYLPKEAKPEHILHRGDLNIAYDTQQGSYYVYTNVTLAPKEYREIEIELKDIWEIETSEIETLRLEARKIYGMLEDTDFSDRAKFLVESIEEKFDTIILAQKVKPVNPEDHISKYRENINLLQDAKSDLGLARTLLSQTKPFALRATWRLILAIIIFLGLLSIVTYIIWQKQVKLSEPPTIEGEKKE